QGVAELLNFAHGQAARPQGRGWLGLPSADELGYLAYQICRRAGTFSLNLRISNKAGCTRYGRWRGEPAVGSVLPQPVGNLPRQRNMGGVNKLQIVVREQPPQRPGSCRLGMRVLLVKKICWH